MKFILATGASGGHLFPAVSVAQELISRGHDVTIVGSLLAQAAHLQERRLNFYDIPTVGFSKGKRLKAAALMAKALVRSYSYLGKHKPDVVMGFGGHGSFALVQAALCRGICAMIHEQNVKPGRANRWLSRFAKKVAISFKDSEKYFNPSKVCLTGCPTHLRVPDKQRAALIKEWGFLPDKAILFIFGGSQGARRINESFLASCEELKNKRDFQIIHVCGGIELDKYIKEYGKLQIEARVFKFLDRMDEAYVISDVVISRAGAATVTELALFQKKAVLVPYPYAGAHQLENARQIEEIGFCEIIEDKDLTPKALFESVERLLNSSKTQRLVKSTEILAGESSKRIADLALGLG